MRSMVWPSGKPLGSMQAPLPSSLTTVGAWARIDNAAGIQGSFNVSSITDNGSGDWTFNFTRPFSNGNYAIIGSTRSGGSFAVNYFIVSATGGATTTTCRLLVKTTDSGTGAGTDDTVNSALFIGR